MKLQMIMDVYVVLTGAFALTVLVRSACRVVFRKTVR